MLKGTFPFGTVGFYATTVGFYGHQMCNFMDKRDQETVLVQRCINGDQVQPIGHFPVIPMPCYSMVHNLQMHPMCFDEFKTGIYGTFG